MNCWISRLTPTVLLLILGCGSPEASKSVATPAKPLRKHQAGRSDGRTTTTAKAEMHEDQANPPVTEIAVTDTLLSFDPASVRVSDSATLGLGLGSATVEILRRADGVCSFRFVHEIEGSYKVYRVDVPTDAGMVTIREQPDGAEVETSFDLKKAKLVGVGGGDVPPSKGSRGAALNQAASDPFFAHISSVKPSARNIEDAGAVTIADPHNKKIVRFVKYLASKGIHLRYHKERGEWYVESPGFGGYAVTVESIRTFPDGTSLREMQYGCLAINLAHGLNPNAELIMSLPGLTRTSDSSAAAISIEEYKKHTEDIRSSPQFIALEKRLKQLFIKYEP